MKTRIAFAAALVICLAFVSTAFAGGVVHHKLLKDGKPPSHGTFYAEALKDKYGIRITGTVHDEYDNKEEIKAVVFNKANFEKTGFADGKIGDKLLIQVIDKEKSMISITDLRLKVSKEFTFDEDGNLHPVKI